MFDDDFDEHIMLQLWNLLDAVVCCCLFLFGLQHEHSHEHACSNVGWCSMMIVVLACWIIDTVLLFGHVLLYALLFVFRLMMSFQWKCAMLCCSNLTMPRKSMFHVQYVICCCAVVDWWCMVLMFMICAHLIAWWWLLLLFFKPNKPCCWFAVLIYPNFPWTCLFCVGLLLL